jgi:hypothetical protein
MRKNNSKLTPLTPDPNVPLIRRFFKKFRFTIIFIIFMAICSYLYYPVEPKVPTAAELYEIRGLPQYINTSTTTFSGNAFQVGKVTLHCDQLSLNGSGGCGFFSIALDKNLAVRALYYWQPTRLWNRYRVLYSLEQDGRIIVTPEQMRAWSMRCYQGQWEWFFIAFYSTVGLVCIIAFCKMFGIKILMFLVKYRNLEEK